MPKRGRLGKDEKRYMADKAYRMTVEEIAEKLDRTVETVQEFINLNVPPPKATAPAMVVDSEKVSIRQELRNSEAWKNLKLEFVGDELKYFEEGYIKMMAQFRNEGVMASEETQIFQAIKFELLMSRNLKERRRCRDDITRLEKMQEDFLHQFHGDPSLMSDNQKEFALNLETQLNVSRQGEQSRTNEYVKLQERHEALMKSLKGSRDQRVKQIESSKVSFLSVIKDLMNRDVQEREGRQMELMKLAGEREYVRLGRPMKYDDGNEDSPILSVETVDLGPEGAVESLDEDASPAQEHEEEDGLA